MSERLVGDKDVADRSAESHIYKFLEFNSFEPVNRTLTPHAKEILELLAAGNYAAKIARIIGINKSAMNYWTRKFLKQGLIRLSCHDVVKIYELTPLGSRILTGSDRGRRVVVLEDYPVKYRVIEWEKVPVAWEKLGQPRNWSKYGFRVGGVRVVKTSKSVIIHPGRIRGFDSYELVFHASRECQRVAHWLESHLGMVLGLGEPVKRPTFQVYDPIAEEVTKSFSFKDDLGGADRSPPSERGHWELTPETAKDYLLAFSRLNQLVQETRNISRRLENLESGMVPSLEVWTKVGNRLLEVLSRLEHVCMHLSRGEPTGGDAS